MDRSARMTLQSTKYTTTPTVQSTHVSNNQPGYSWTSHRSSRQRPLPAFHGFFRVRRTWFPPSLDPLICPADPDAANTTHPDPCEKNIPKRPHGFNQRRATTRVAPTNTTTAFRGQDALAPGVTAPTPQTSLPGPLSQGREGVKAGLAGRTSIDTLNDRISPSGTFACPVHPPITVPPSLGKGVRGKVRGREGGKTGLAPSMYFNAGDRGEIACLVRILFVPRAWRKTHRARISSHVSPLPSYRIYGFKP